MIDSKDDVSVSSDKEQTTSKEVQTDDLDWWSDRLDRAIRGIFVLTFQKVPKWIGDSLKSLFNFIWESIRKSFIWLFWTLPRQVIKWFVKYANYLLRLVKIFMQFLTLFSVVFGPLLVSLTTGLFLVGSIVWCVIAIIGAVWGLLYLNRRKWKIGQTVGRLSNKLKFWQQGRMPDVVEK